MSTKKIALSFISIILLAFSFGYSLVFAGGIGKIYFKKSNNIFYDSVELNSSRIILQSREKAKSFLVTGDCNPFAKLVKSENNFHVFDISFLDTHCDKDKLDVYFNLGDSFIKERFNVIKTIDFYNQFLDKSDKDLLNIYNKLAKNGLKLKEYEDYTLNSGIEYLDFLKKNRQLEEINYTKNIVKNILDSRNEKYKIPVLGGTLSSKYSKLPNAGRPYRSSYTDGIHHGFDFDAPFHSTAVSLDDGVVIRVVNGFTFSDLNNIQYGDNLSDEIKTKNLDILRGNQVWIKTMKGDIAFYSHLDMIFDNIKEGAIVNKGEPIGLVGKTGVPDKSYEDYHLHIPIHKNPHTGNTYSLEDVMNWDWYFKGDNVEYIIENQSKLFE